MSDNLLDLYKIHMVQLSSASAREYTVYGFFITLLTFCIKEQYLLLGLSMSLIVLYIVFYFNLKHAKRIELLKYIETKLCTNDAHYYNKQNFDGNIVYVHYLIFVLFTVTFLVKLIIFCIVNYIFVIL